MRLLLTLLMLVMGVFAPSQSVAQPSADGICDYAPATSTLRVSGRTDSAMLECVRSLPSDGARTLRITSSGGDVESALDIAEIISGWSIELVVDQQCNSSCANFIIPVARRVSVRPGGVIMLHGSIDPGLVASLSDPAQRAEVQRVADRQAAFAASHGIPRGWLLFRTQYSGGLAGVQGLTGTLYQNVALSRAVGVIVSERLIESCLPNVELGSFERIPADLSPRTEAMRQRWARRGAHVSGTLRCE